MTCCCKPTADNVSLWAMRDDHTFKRYRAKSVKSLMKQWRRDQQDEPDLSLCPIIVCAGDKELRRVGKMLHGYKRDKDNERQFKRVAMCDPDITRLMQAGYCK